MGFSEAQFLKHSKKIDCLFQENYEPLADKARTRTGSREIFAWTEKNGIQNTIYSNHTVPNIHRQLKRLKIDKFITAVLARNLGDISHMHKNSKEKKLFNYVEKHKFKAHEVISIGDTEEEIEIGSALIAPLVINVQGKGYHNVYRTELSCTAAAP